MALSDRDAQRINLSFPVANDVKLGDIIKQLEEATGETVKVSWSDVTGKPSTFTPPAATTSTIGGVKKAAHVDPESGTAADIINALIAAGVME